MNAPTWPDPVIRLATAIAVAEGSDPLWNNPLDMTISLGFPTNGKVNAEGVLRFVNPEDGWYVGCHQCFLMLSGKSHVYNLSDTLEQVGLKYSGGDPNWAKNVAASLRVPTITTLAAVAHLAALSS